MTDIKEATQKYAQSFISDIRTKFEKMDAANEKDDHETYDEIQESFSCDALGIGIRQIIEVTIAWGGPAAKIVYDVDSQSSSIQYQDWFQPWTTADLDSEEQEYLDRYVEVNLSGLIGEVESNKISF